MTYRTEPSVFDAFERTFLKAIAFDQPGELHLTIEAVHEARLFELRFLKTFAYSFEVEGFSGPSRDVSDSPSGPIAVSTDTQRLREFVAAFPWQADDLRDYCVCTTSEIVRVVCQGACKVTELAT